MNLGLTLRSVMNEVRGYWQGPYSLSNPNIPLSTSLFGGGGYRTDAGVSVSEETALRYSAVWSAVTQISQAVGSLPLSLYQLKGGARSEFIDHDLHYLIHIEPNPEMTSMIFRETLQGHVLLWGNGYAEIVRNGKGRPQSLLPLHPTRVQPFRDGFGRLLYRVDGETILSPDRMFHIKGFGGDGIVGYSVIGMARQNLGLGLAAEQFGATFFGNGASLGGIFTHPGKLTKEIKQGLRESLEQMHQGPDKAHRVAFLGDDMKYTRIGIPPNDAQFIETRKFGISDVARWFNIQPHLLKDLERATFSNIEHQSIEFAKFTIGPWCVRWEEELRRQLVATSEKSIQYFKHNMNALERGDIQTRYTALGIARDKGIINADEWRALEDMNPQPDGQGQLYLVQQAQVPVKQLENLIQSEIDKNKQPPQPPQSGGVRAEQIDKILEDIAALAQSTAEHRQAVGALVQSVRDLHLVPDELRQQVKEHLDTIKVQEQAIATKQSQIVQLTEERDHARTQHEQTAAELTALRSAHDAAVALQIDTEAKRKEAEAAVAERERELSDAKKEAADLFLTANITRQEAEKLGHALELAEANAETARKEADTARQDAERAQADLTTATENLGKAEQAAKDAEEARVAAEDIASGSVVARENAEEIARDLCGETLQAKKDAEASRALAESEKQAAEAAEAARVAADEARQASENALLAHRDTAAERDARVIAALRELFVADFGRMVRRETEKARRNQATPAKLRAWAESFYMLHEDTCIEALRPAVRAYLAWLGSDADVDATTGNLIGPNLRIAERQIRAIADGDPDDYSVALEKLLSKWETDRPNALADVILREGIAHVRAL